MALGSAQSRFAGHSTLLDLTSADPVPVVLEIDGRLHLVTRISEHGVATIDFDGEAKPGQIIQVAFHLGCDGFDISVPALWEVTAHDPDRHRLELRLAPVNEASHLATMNTFLAAIAAGEVITSAQALEIARAGMAASPAGDTAGQGPSRGQAIKRRAGAISFVLLAALLIGFVGANLVGRAFVVEADGSISNPGSVTSVMPADAEVVEVLAAVGSRVGPGAPVAIVRTKEGQLLTATSPCECAVAGQLAETRAFLRKGDPLVQLVPVAGANMALLSVRLTELRRIRVGDSVMLSFFDGDAKVAGTVEIGQPAKGYRQRPRASGELQRHRQGPDPGKAAGMARRRAGNRPHRPVAAQPVRLMRSNPAPRHRAALVPVGAGWLGGWRARSRGSRRYLAELGGEIAAQPAEAERPVAFEQTGDALVAAAREVGLQPGEVGFADLGHVLRIAGLLREVGRILEALDHPVGQPLEALQLLGGQADVVGDATLRAASSAARAHSCDRPRRAAGA